MLARPPVTCAGSGARHAQYRCAHSSRYRLLAQRAQTHAGGTIRLVSEREFPISVTMTGALMHIKPGGLRELHWHPNANEWQY
jgi:oxalate decarboxylase